MKCKGFKILITDDSFDSDVENLNNFLSKTKVNFISSSPVHEKESYWAILVFYDDEASGGGLHSHHPRSDDKAALSQEEGQLFQKLRQWRNNLAEQKRVPSYMIAHNNSLKQLVRLRVTSKGDMYQIKGFDADRIDKYGEDIIEIIKSSLPKFKSDLPF